MERACLCAGRPHATEPTRLLHGTSDTLLVNLGLTASWRFLGNTASVDNLLTFKSALLLSSGEEKNGPTLWSCPPLMGCLATVLVALGSGRLGSSVWCPSCTVGRGGAFTMLSMGSSPYKELSINSSADGWAMGDIGSERSCVLQGPLPASFPAFFPLKSRFCRYGNRQAASSEGAQTHAKEFIVLMTLPPSYSFYKLLPFFALASEACCTICSDSKSRLTGFDPLSSGDWSPKRQRAGSRFSFCFAKNSFRKYTMKEIMLPMSVIITSLQL